MLTRLLKLLEAHLWFSRRLKRSGRLKTHRFATPAHVACMMPVMRCLDQGAGTGLFLRMIGETTMIRILFVATMFLLLAANARSVTRPVVGLPSSIHLYAGNDSGEVLAGYRSVFIKLSTDTIYTAIALPSSFYKEFVDVEIGCIAISPNGRYVFVGCQGANGLYRYDTEDNSWMTTLPNGASRSVSAIHYTSNGLLVVGCGGYASDLSSAAVGLFESADNGDSWEYVEFDFEAKSSIAGILAITSTNKNELVVGTKLGSSEMSSGVFIRKNDAIWKQVTSISTGAIVAGENAIFLLGQSTHNVIMATQRPDESFNTTNVNNTYGATDISVLADGKVLLVKHDSREYTDSVFYIHDSTCSYSGVAFGPLKYERRTIKPSHQKMNSILVLGGGNNAVISLINKEAEMVVANTELPTITDLLSTKNFVVVHVYRHGWYKIDRSGLCNRVGEYQDAPFNSRSSTSSIDNETALCLSGRKLIRISATHVDTIYSFVGDFIPNYVCEIDANTMVASNIGTVLVVYINDNRVETLGMGDWPTIEFNGETTPLQVGRVFYIKGQVYAWAEGSNTPTSSYESGGLFRYSNAAWLRADSHIHGELTNISSAVSDDSCIMLAVNQNLNGAASTAPIVSALEPDSPMKLVGSQRSLTNRIRAITFTRNYCIWSNSIGEVWITNRADNTQRSSSEYGVVSHVGRLGDTILLATDRLGVLMIEHDDFPTSVTSSIGFETSSPLTLYPNPVLASREVSFTLMGNCSSSHSQLEISCLQGRALCAVNDLSTTLDLCSLQLPRSSGMEVSGTYIVTLYGRECRHTGLLMIVR